MDSASRKVDSASHMKMAVDSTSWMKNSASLMNNSASPMKITIRLDELKNNSASRMSFLLDMYECVSVELQGGNSTGGLKDLSRIEGTRRVTLMTRRVGMCFKELGE